MSANWKDWKVYDNCTTGRELKWTSTKKFYLGWWEAWWLLFCQHKDISALFEPCVAFCRIILPLLFVGCSGVVHRQESIFQCHHHSFRLIATMAFLTTVSKICKKNLVRKFHFGKILCLLKILIFYPSFYLIFFRAGPALVQKAECANQ